MEITYGISHKDLITSTYMDCNRMYDTLLCYHKDNNTDQYVIKKYQIKDLYNPEQSVQIIENEFLKAFDISNHSDLPENICKYVGFTRNEKEIIVITKYINAISLKNILSNQHQYNIEQIKKYILSLINCNRYLEKHQQYNYRINYNNILFDSDKVYITDWSMLTIEQALERQGARAKVLTQVFNDPYLYSNGKYAEFNTITYCLGIVFHSFISNTVYKVRRFPPVNIQKSYIEHKEFVSRMLKPDPFNRPNLNVLYEYFS